MRLRPQDIEWTIERLETELAYRQSKESLAFQQPSPDERVRHLLPFVLHNVPGYLPGWVHVRVCEVLERFVRRIERQDSPRLILTMPPRAGKSEIVSRNLPDWYLGRNPHHEVVVASYGQDLADEMSRGARAHRERNLDIFPHLAPKPRGKDGIQFWETIGEGSYNAVGAGGPLVGRGFHLGIIDDPVKNPEAADSEIEREKLWKWYQGAFYTRAAPGAGILIMATRWHTDDLIGRIIRAMEAGEGEPFEILNFPAIADDDEHHPDTGSLLRRAGEALHPARYDVDAYARIRQAVGERVWLAQFLCRPTSDTGGVFRRTWYDGKVLDIDWLRPPEPYDEVALSIDTNLKKGSGSARASIGTWGRHGFERYTRLTESVGRYTYTELRKAAHHAAKVVNPSFILVEEAAVGPALIADLEELGWTVIAFTPAKWGSKEQRAELAARHHEAGKVYAVRAAWTQAWVGEHVDFPVGKYKDRVDEGAQIVIYWQERARAGQGIERATSTMGLLAEIMGGRSIR